MANDEADIQIIEINGVKLEVDMRHAKRIEHLRVGTRVKVLVKGYGNDFKVHPGVVVGFEPFPDLPSIVVCYVDQNWSSVDIKFVTINAKSGADMQIVAAMDDDLQVDRATIIDVMRREITKKEQEIEAVRERIAYFERNFATYWSHVSAGA